MKKSTLFAAFLSLAASASAAIPGPFSQVTDIDDLALIYIGSQHRPDWTKETFRPYVMHKYADGSQSWMFDGFLMIDFLAYNDETGRQVSFGETVAEVDGAKRSDWERLLRVQLGTESGQGCRALDDLIDELIPELDEPAHKHKIVLCLPVAEPKSDVWGEANGVRLDFNKTEDCITGMKWYADLIETEWRKARFKHLELDGVYWTNETFYGRNEKMVKDVNAYYHNKGKKIYWIPYLTRYTEKNAPKGFVEGDLMVNQSADTYADFGVDVCYVQAGYYFRAGTPYNYLYQATDYAWAHPGVGVEFEFEGYNYSYDPKTKTRTRYTPANCGLYQCQYNGQEGYFYNRFKDYIDAYEQEGMSDFKPLSYYSGFQAVYDYVTSGNRMDAQIIHRLATMLNNRHIASGWDEKPRAAGIEDVVAAADIDVHAVEGAIFVSADNGAPFSVYSVDGVCITSQSASDTITTGVTVPCAAGLYVVRVGDKSFKVLVK